MKTELDYQRSGWAGDRIGILDLFKNIRLGGEVWKKQWGLVLCIFITVLIYRVEKYSNNFLKRESPRESPIKCFTQQCLKYDLNCKIVRMTKPLPVGKRVVNWGVWEP